MNQIIANYKYGHQRVINLHSSFFTDADLPVFNIKNGKMSRMSPADKAVDVAKSLDPDLYTVELIKNGETVIKHTYPQNKPEDNGTKRFKTRITS